MNQRESKVFPRLFRCDPKGFASWRWAEGLPNGEGIATIVGYSPVNAIALMWRP
jgi:hypothetical protein